ncbi:HAMP domain-containing sensor histidine kinase [Porticoccus sp. W117]|uniref:sensor histidine kinase n=1 Tax=Porticoccus sp. W117 TaxID=3054777 RepID=UPI002594EECE|nr:HAMP domain-containing sensor histidine kinase [Porticoccus sp. W117]MDM3871888.1 HAMP domain-containing sensor histidine kinase [Porticoccus sp. W117]
MHIRSVFWKIFLVLWVTSTLVVISSSGLLYMEQLKQLYREEWKQSHRAELQGLIAQYENFGGWRDLYGGRIPYNYSLHMQVFESDTATMIYGLEDSGDSERWHTFEYVSGSGRSYQVQIPSLEGVYWPSVYLAILDVTLPRWLLTLLVSGLFSVFLALVVIRPVKQLRSHIDTMGAGELDTRLDRKLTRRQDEFGSLARSFNDMADHVQNLVNSKQQLLHDVSHELRAPLARLQVAGELARCEAQSAGIDNDMYDRLEQECGALNRLIDEILTLSRAESGAEEVLQWEPCDLTQMVEKIVADARFLDSEQQIAMKVSGRPRSVELPAGEFEKAYKNILENALKYGQGKPVDTEISYGRRKLVLTVADRGPGMKAEDLQKIFTPFYRAKAYNSKEGYGLGMSITHKAVQQMRGEVKAQNRPRGGLLVSIELPYDGLAR